MCTSCPFLKTGLVDHIGVLQTSINDDSILLSFRSKTDFGINHNWGINPSSIPHPGKVNY